MNGFISDRMKIAAKAFLLALALLSGPALGAQVIKDIYVSQEQPYTDHLALKQDSRDTDVMVKFQYSEEKNTLTLSVISYRTLFVFREPTRYGSLINFFSRIQPENFPYVVTAEPKAKFRFSDELRRSIKGPRNNHVFNKWIEYRGLQPQDGEYKMVNDYIEQAFDVLPAGDVSVTLRDIFLLEGGEIMCGKDLQTRYNITIGHDPCFGKDEEIAEANTTLENLFQNYKALKESSKGGVADNQQVADLFGQLKEAVQTQFLHKDVRSACMAVQNIWDVYNDFVDSVAVMKCVYVPRKIGLDANVILMNARAIDENVTRWLNSTDPLERRDLEQSTDELISGIEGLVRDNGLVGIDQTKAYSVFKAAADYSRGIFRKK